MRNYFTKKEPIVFESPLCTCRATESGVEWCDEDHRPWIEAIGPALIKDKSLKFEAEVGRTIERLSRNGIPSSFEHILERYSKGDPSFHRPVEVPFDEEAPSAAIGLFIYESFGAVLTACSEPNLYATYLAGKATQGLNENMWQEDRLAWLEGKDVPPVFIEEIVVDGCLDVAAAESMWGRSLNPELLWLFGREEEAA